jgi:hypothetical protein
VRLNGRRQLLPIENLATPSLPSPEVQADSDELYTLQCAQSFQVLGMQREKHVEEVYASLLELSSRSTWVQPTAGIDLNDAV